MEVNVLVGPDVGEVCAVSWLQGNVQPALVAQGAGANTEMCLVITSQQRVQELNRSYLGRDEPTDVLAFHMIPLAGEPGGDVPPFVTPPDGLLPIGEVIISYPQAVIQAEEHQHSVKKELAILIIHGVLHLLGYDHAEPEQQRRLSAREAEILSSVQERLS